MIWLRIPDRNNRWGHKQWLKTGIAPFTIIPNDPLRDLVLPIPATLNFVELEVLVPRGGIFLLGHTGRVPLN